MSTQLFEDGQLIQLPGIDDLECVAVSYQEVDGEKQNFVYGFRLKSEVDAEREAAERLENPEAVEETKQPEPIEEEIQNVK